MQIARIERPRGPKPVTVDVNGEPKGVVVAQDRGFRFVAVKLDAFALDGQVFASVEEATDAVRAATRG